MLVGIAACAGTRGSLEMAGPELAEMGRATRVQYFGEGCYALDVPTRQRWQHLEIVACSVDVLPDGGRWCVSEPDVGSQIGFGPPRFPRDEQRSPKALIAMLDRESYRERASFVTALNEHRCHRRWEDQLVCDRVIVEARAADRPMRASSVPWPSDLGTLRVSIEMPPSTRTDALALDEAVAVDVELCIGSDGTVSPSLGYYLGHSTSPIFREALAAVTRGATSREQRGRCTTARLEMSKPRCRNPVAITVVRQ